MLSLRTFYTQVTCNLAGGKPHLQGVHFVCFVQLGLSRKLSGFAYASAAAPLQARGQALCLPPAACHFPFLVFCLASCWRRFRSFSFSHYVLRLFFCSFVPLVGAWLPSYCLGWFCGHSSFCCCGCFGARCSVGCCPACHLLSFSLCGGWSFASSSCLGFLARVLFWRGGGLLGWLAGVPAPCLVGSSSGSGWWSYLARALARAGYSQKSRSQVKNMTWLQ